MLLNKVKEFYHQLTTKQFNISLVTMGYLLVCYTLLRLGFLLANHQFFSGVSAGEIIWSFIYGLRFDISALLMINGALLLLYNLPGNPARWRWFKRVLLALFWFINLAWITLNLADYGYFPTIQRRLMSEIYTILPDIIRTLPSMLIEFWYLTLILIVLGILFVFSSWKLLKWSDQKIRYRFNIIKESIFLILICGLMLLGIRGGMQSRPIRQAHAFFSPNRVVGFMTLNSTFTILRSISQTAIPVQNLLPPDEATKLLETMLRQGNEQMIDSQYPFLRVKNFTDTSQKRNLVIFIMESWTSDYIGSITGHQPSATPFFDSIADKGMLFTNFLANGERSMIATSSVLSSIPGLYSKSTIGARKTMINSQSEFNRFIGLGTILLREGYLTSFHHGARTGSMGFDAYSKLSGFLNYYGKEDYPNLTSEVIDGTWGIWDEEFFLDSARRMNGFKEPFCSVIFSLTSHAPFKIPPQRKALFNGYSNESAFQKVLRYSDYSIQQFFNAVHDKPWFKNTIFIITGDHTNYAKGNNFHSYFHVPLLIYAPDLIKPQRCNQIGSQVDILPTILDILHISTNHASMGRSLIDTSQTHYTVVSNGTHYALFTDKFVLMNDLEKNVGLYDYRTDTMFKNDLQQQYPQIAEELKRKFYAYIQEVTYAIANDKVCRDQDLKTNK
jgi:phosphoglycerol transferase MdoB-like AlkP superfamily enzyme